MRTATEARSKTLKQRHGTSRTIKVEMACPEGGRSVNLCAGKRISVDRRYYLSLIILGMLILVAWSIAPSRNEDVTAEVGSDASGSKRSFVSAETTGTNSQTAIPIVGLSDQPTISAEVDAEAFSQQVETEENLTQIPERKSQASLAALTPIGFRSAEETAGAPQSGGNSEGPRNAIHGDVAGRDAVEDRERQRSGASLAFSMPNTQSTGRPIPSKLPNDRLVLKPIAKLASPFAETSSADAPKSDPVFENLANDKRPSFSSNPFGNRDSRDSLASVRLSSSGQSKESTPGNRPTPRPSISGAGIPRRDVYIWHVIEPNQTLPLISRQYFGDDQHVQAIQQMNPDIIQNPELLPVGEAIRVPTN